MPEEMLKKFIKSKSIKHITI